MVTTLQPTKQLNIQLPPLHPGQEEVVNHPARFKVVVCGRRWGKTTLGAWKATKTALEGGKVWWIAPTYPLTWEGWTMLRRLAHQIPGTVTHEADRYITFPGGGEVWAKSAVDPLSLVSTALNGVVFDEVAKTREIAWTESIRACLADFKGWALFIGTPKGKNWVFNLFNRRQHDSDWMSWQMPTKSNPYIDPAEVDAARADMPEWMFKQEFEADFGASQLQVYSQFDRYVHRWKWAIPRFSTFFGGLDFAGTTIGSHKSAGACGGFIEGTDILLTFGAFEQSGTNILERQLEWMANQQHLVDAICKKQGSVAMPIHWRADKSERSGIQFMQMAGLPVLPTVGGPDSIYEGVSLVQRALEVRPDGFARLYYSPSIESIFAPAVERYRYPDFEEDSDTLRAKNPLAVNDDYVTSVRYMVEGAHFAVIGDPNQLYKHQLATVGN